MLHIDEVYDWSCSLINKYGTWRAVVPGYTRIFTADPVNVEHILKSKFANYPKGALFQDFFGEFLGDGIFNADDDLWVVQRKTASHEFSARSLRDHMVSTFQGEVAGRLLPFLQTACESGHEFDLQELLLRFTFDSICLIAFGKDPGCLRPGLPQVSFADAFDSMTATVFYRTVVPPFIFRLKRWLALGSEKDTKKSLKVLEDFTSSIIQARKLEIAKLCPLAQKEDVSKDQSGGAGAPHGPREAFEVAYTSVARIHLDLLSRFIRLPCDGGHGPTDTFLRDVIINFILAGRDTSAVALTWFFWVLSSHSQVEERIIQEVMGVLHARSVRKGSHDRDSWKDTVFSYEELKGMVYLHAALSESMRLHPPVPMDQKYAREADTLPDGTNILAGMHVIYDVYSMGRMERIWGKDCLQFRPDRWLKDGVFVPVSPFKYPVFNAGPRMCLGKDMAFLLMKSVVASTLLNFRLKVAEGFHARYKLSVTLGMKGGLPVTVSSR